MHALILFGEDYPEYRREHILACVNKAAIYIENHQKEDGSWFAHIYNIVCINFIIFSMLNDGAIIIYNRYGTWGICFIYGTFFAIKGLIAAGRTYENSICIRKACNFLLSTQLTTGGWSESYLSCEREVNTLFRK